MFEECRNGSIKERLRWFEWSYVVDYVLVLVVIIGLIVANFAFNPYNRYLPVVNGLNNPEFSYPYVTDEVPSLALLPINIVFPLLIFLSYFIYFRDYHDLHHAILGFAEALSFTLFFTAVFKVFAGEYRPNYYEYSITAPKEARVSFPSGHSSMSFCAQLYVSCYFAGKSGLFISTGGQMWKVLVAFIPLFSAGLIAVSRTRDYHHSFADITAGAVLGATIAYFCYFLNYPNLSAKNCHKPKLRKKLVEETKPILSENLDSTGEANK